MQQPLLGNGSANRHERSNSTATVMGSGVFCLVRAEMFKPDKLGAGVNEMFVIY
jgi:hypothetical protein